jgi:hypothetical protein
MSEFVAAPPEARTRRRALARLLSPWALTVLCCAGVLATAASLLGGWWLATRGTTNTTYTLSRALLGLELRVQSGDVTIVGGSQAGVSVVRTDRFAFDHRPLERRSVVHGILHLSAACPALVVGSCSSSYRIEVPDNVPISVRAEHGSVHVEGYHGSADIATNSGGIVVDGYCGFVLGAASAGGNVTVSTSCSPERLTLRSGSGNVEATVPAGNYRINAVSNAGRAQVLGLVSDNGAPWDIEALSNSGNVTVSAGT